jgi:hypothetical protein
MHSRNIHSSTYSSYVIMMLHARIHKQANKEHATATEILAIINCTGFYLKDNISETGLSLTSDGTSQPALSIGPNWVGTIWRQRQSRISEMF